MSDSSQFGIFKTVFYYSVFIILAPISTFFSVKVFIFEGLFSTATVTSNVWSAIAAVIVLHVALGLYIYRAYSDTSPTRIEKDDKID